MLSNGVEAIKVGTRKYYSISEILSGFEKAYMKVPNQIVNRREGNVAVCYTDLAIAKGEFSRLMKQELNVS